MHALIIDDSRAMRTILSRMLLELGFESTTLADHGRHALELIDGRPAPDLVLVDWNMPEMSGIEFIEALRGRPEYLTIPVIMVTSECEPRRIYDALRAGADEYAMKPLTRDALREKLALVGVEAVP